MDEMIELRFRAFDGESMRYDVTGFEHGNKNEMAGVFLDGVIYLIDGANHSDLIMSIHPLASVMQYTGLKDKNSADIYEGDILAAGEVPPREVYFDNGSFRLRDSESNQADQSIVEFTALRMSVVGNIHQNPELLK